VSGNFRGESQDNLKQFTSTNCAKLKHLEFKVGHVSVHLGQTWTFIWLSFCLIHFYFPEDYLAFLLEYNFGQKKHSKLTIFLKLPKENLEISEATTNWIRDCCHGLRFVKYKQIEIFLICALYINLFIVNPIIHWLQYFCSKSLDFNISLFQSYPIFLMQYKEALISILCCCLPLMTKILTSAIQFNSIHIYYWTHYLHCKVKLQRDVTRVLICQCITVIESVK